ncbi:MAG: hypothetical protein HQL23_01025 [Candidatus Omnitrophica bacterium]|nr:hypothetical protein [Candidatus Omnitrophota bacterium]
MGDEHAGNQAGGCRMSVVIKTTALTCAAEKASDLVLLGPWCLYPGEETPAGAWGQSRFPLFPTPWSRPDSVKEASAYCQKIYDFVLPQLAENLNRVLGFDWKVKSWEMLLDSWLLIFIQITYERYERLRQAVAAYPDALLFVLPESQCRLQSETTHDFIARKSEDDFFNLSIYSGIAWHFYPSRVAVQNDFGPGRDAPARQKRGGKDPAMAKLKTEIGNQALQFLFRKGKKIILQDLYHFRFQDFWALRRALPRDTIRLLPGGPSGSGLETRYDASLRRQISLTAGFDDFSIWLAGILPQAVPLSLLEALPRYRRQTRSLWSRIPEPQAVISAIGWYYNDFFKFAAAEALQRGAKTIELQHGSGYGWYDTYFQENLSRNKDVFFSWGEKDVPRRVVQPFSNPYLARLKDAHDPREDRLLFIGTLPSKYYNRFSNWINVDFLEDYFQRKKQFFSALTPRILGKMSYKFYELKWAQEVSRIKADFPQIQIAPAKPSAELIRASVLVVVDNAQTAFIEALVMNAPCVAFWNPRVYVFRPESQKYMDALLAAGIVYHDAASAARQVNAIYSDPSAWWSRPEVQQARRDFCQRFGFSKKHWTEDWQRHFGQGSAYV